MQEFLKDVASPVLNRELACPVMDPLKTEIRNSANVGMDEDPSKTGILKEFKEQDSWCTGLL